jgi:hypothetical protein
MPLHPEFVSRILEEPKLTLTLQYGWGWQKKLSAFTSEDIEAPPSGKILVRNITPLILEGKTIGFRGTITSSPEMFLGMTITTMLHSTLEVDGRSSTTLFSITISAEMPVMVAEPKFLLGWMPKPTVFPTFRGWADMAPISSPP